MSSAVPALPSPAVLDRLEGFLGELVAALDPAPLAAAPARGRPPVLPGLLLWSGLLVCVAAPHLQSTPRKKARRRQTRYPAQPVHQAFRIPRKPQE